MCLISAPAIGKDPKLVFVTQKVRNSLILNGALGGTRTPDTLVRSQVLYPAELRAQEVGDVVGRIGIEPMTQRLKAFCSTD